MVENRMAQMYENDKVQAHIIDQLRKRVQKDRPAEKIRDLNELRLEEQIEKNEQHLKMLKAELKFIRNLDLSLLEPEES